VGDREPMTAGAGWAVASAATRTHGAVGPPAGARPSGPRADFDVVVAGRRRRYAAAFAGDVLWLGCEGATWALRRIEGRRARTSRGLGAGGTVASPMPGTVQAVAVAVGDEVVAGETLAVVEAMKMEYAVTASVAGTVTAVHVRSGQTVALDQPIAEITVSVDEAAAPTAAAPTTAGGRDG
jgi:acetyl-CoA/propionyl-CoA carboxylase biotin carboxyl carrier protein